MSSAAPSPSSTTPTRPRSNSFTTDNFHRKNKHSSKGINVSHLANFKYQSHVDTASRSGNLAVPSLRSSYSSTSTISSRVKQQTARQREARARKALRSAFYLQSSSQHAFVLRRDFVLQSIQEEKRRLIRESHDAPQQICTKKTCSTLYLKSSDAALPWEAVEIVKIFVEASSFSATSASRGSETISNSTQQILCCPICLDEFKLAPRCLPCGHVFCLPCILHHCYTSLSACAPPSSVSLDKKKSAADSFSSAQVKCPCCSDCVSVPEDLRSVQFVTVSPPTINDRMTFLKLYRIKKPAMSQSEEEHKKAMDGKHHPALISNAHMYEDMFPCQIIVPPMDSDLNNHNSGTDVLPPAELPLPNMSHPNAMYYRLNIQDIKPYIYLQQLSSDLVAIQDAIQEYSGVALEVESMDLIFLKLSLDMVQEEVHLVQQQVVDAELKEERRLRLSSHEHGTMEHVKEHGEGGSSLSATAIDHNNGQETEATVELQHDISDTHSMKEHRHSHHEEQEQKQYQPFYQTSDGQLCFLSGFNMACLNHEHNGMYQYLPSIIEGQVVNVETVHMTHETRKRLTFLHHLPLYTDVKLVELNLFAIQEGKPYLSEETKRKFQREHEKRRKRRKQKKREERRLDKLLAEQEAEEVQKRQQQRINFASDEFFQPAPVQDASSPFSDEFGPSLSANPTRSAPIAVPSAPAPDSIFSFKNVCATGGVWPGLSDSVSSSPGVRGIPAISPPTGTWGGRKTQSSHTLQSHQVNPSLTATLQRDLTLSSSPSSPGVSAPAAKSKNKGKKVLLFSTGGHRGSG